MLTVCLLFLKSELNYAYKLHAYKKESVSLKNTSQASHWHSCQLFCHYSNKYNTYLLFHNDMPEGSINDIHNRERISMININNSYWFINRVFDKVQDDFMRQQTVEPLSDTAVLNDVRKQKLLLPYAGQSGCILVKSLKTHLKKTLPKFKSKGRYYLHRQWIIMQN